MGVARRMLVTGAATVVALTGLVAGPVAAHSVPLVRLPPDSGPDPAGDPGPPAGPLPRQLFVPDLIAATPAGLTQSQLSRIRALPGVRATLAVAGGRITVNGRPADVIGVPQAFRAWTPPATAAATAAWALLARGGLLVSGHAASRLGLGGRAPSKPGKPSPPSGQVPSGQVPVTGAVTVSMQAGTARDLGVPGVDAVVNAGSSARLGLVSDVAVLINAPGAGLTALMERIRAITGPGGQVRNLVPVVTVSKLPVTPAPAGAVPANFLQLYQYSAARYCPGLSWTVLAAIGEIESGDGANNGPSSAGALGPMQFLPSTWAVYGIDGFNDTGPPDIMNPLDAVPSAARMLCANGAASGPGGLRGAIFAYNHADWYVSEVLQLAAEYAAAYPAAR